MENQFLTELESACEDFEEKILGKDYLLRLCSVRYNEPNVVNLINIVSIYSAVLSPGLIPGIYPPYFLKFSAVSVGLKTIEV